MDTLEIKSDLGELKRVREFIHAFCHNIPPTRLEKPLCQIELAGNEVVANIIKHAYEKQPGQPIRIEAIQTVDSVSFRFYDWGQNFDPDRGVTTRIRRFQRGRIRPLHYSQQRQQNIVFNRLRTGRNCTTLTIKTTGKK